MVAYYPSLSRKTLPVMEDITILTPHSHTALHLSHHGGKVKCPTWSAEQSKGNAMQCSAVHVPLPCYQYFIINFTIFYWIIIGLSFLSNRTSLFQALNDDYCNPLVPSYCPDLPRRHRSRTWVTKLPQLGPPWPYFYSHYICMM